MKRRGAAWLGALALVVPGVALADAAATAAAVRAADEAWESRTEAVGPAQSIPETIDATDSLFFSSGPPLKGHDAISAAAKANYPAGSKLGWKVVTAYGSKGGDMGATSGDWTFTAPGIKPIHGRYVTVWRKDATGQWKALMDIGTPDAG